MKAAPRGTSTVVLDGLLEGPLPPEENGEDLLRDWCKGAAAARLHFNLSVDGGGFSLLADAAAHDLDQYQDFPDTMRQALENLLELFPANLRGRIFSTLRSTERLQGTVRQCLYLTSSKGVEVRERKVAEDGAPGAPPPPRSRPILFLVGAALLALVLGASTLVIDYPATWRRLRESVTSVDPKLIEVDAAAVSRYLAVTVAGVDETKTRLVLDVRRTGDFPTSLAAYQAEETRARDGGRLRDLLVLRRVVGAGRIRIECLDREGKLLGMLEESVRDLEDRAAVPVEVPVRGFPGTVRVRVLD